MLMLKIRSIYNRNNKKHDYIDAQDYGEEEHGEHFQIDAKVA